MSEIGLPELASTHERLHELGFSTPQDVTDLTPILMGRAVTLSVGHDLHEPGIFFNALQERGPLRTIRTLFAFAAGDEIVVGSHRNYDELFAEIRMVRGEPWVSAVVHRRVEEYRQFEGDKAQTRLGEIITAATDVLRYYD